MGQDPPRLRLIRGLPDDAALVRGVAKGDPGALRNLMDRYDRLVRYAIYRNLKGHCLRDPTFVDARASEVWAGFVESVRRPGSGVDDNLKAYLIRIARNKCHDFLRRTAQEPVSGGLLGEAANLTDPDPDPLSVLLELEQVETLRQCIAELPANDRNLFSQLDLIVNGRWTEAARRLSVPESTLRSRWPRVLSTLRASFSRTSAKFPKSFAPKPEHND